MTQAIEKTTSWQFDEQPKEAVDHCILCGTNHPRLLTKVDRYLHIAPFVLCERCGLVWHTPRMTAEGYRRFYREGIYRNISRKFCEAHGGVDQRASESYARLVSHVYEPVLKRAKGWSLLDVGGSDGLLAKVLRDQWQLGETAVLEPATDEVNQVPEGMTRYVGSLEEIDIGKQFDLVCCFQTIEHFVDPRAALEKLRTLTGRYLLLDCINFPLMWRSLRHNTCKIDHPWNFHYEALRCLLYQVGFKPVDMVFRKDKPTTFFSAVPKEPEPNKLPGPAFVGEVLRMFRK